VHVKTSRKEYDMPDQRRCKGYVSGKQECPYQPGNFYWKVRVKDPTCPQHGKWLVVASVHDDIALAKGLNVNFVIGWFDGASGKFVLKAIDVQIEVPPNSAHVI